MVGLYGGAPGGARAFRSANPNRQCVAGAHRSRNCVVCAVLNLRLSVHPAAKFQFERVAREFAQWRPVPEAQRSPAPVWWWQPAFEVREQSEDPKRCMYGVTTSNYRSGRPSRRAPRCYWPRSPIRHHYPGPTNSPARSSECTNRKNDGRAKKDKVCSA